MAFLLLSATSPEGQGSSTSCGHLALLRYRCMGACLSGNAHDLCGTDGGCVPAGRDALAQSHAPGITVPLILTDRIGTRANEGLAVVRPGCGRRYCLIETSNHHDPTVWRGILIQRALCSAKGDHVDGTRRASRILHRMGLHPLPRSPTFCSPPRRNGRPLCER